MYTLIYILEFSNESTKIVYFSEFIFGENILYYLLFYIYYDARSSNQSGRIKKTVLWTVHNDGRSC